MSKSEKQIEKEKARNLQYNDNFNHYMVHQEGVAAEKYEKFHKSLYSMNTRLHWMYEKAKEDKI